MRSRTGGGREEEEEGGWGSMLMPVCGEISHCDPIIVSLQRGSPLLERLCCCSVNFSRSELTFSLPPEGNLCDLFKQIWNPSGDALFLHLLHHAAALRRA